MVIIKQISLKTIPYKKIYVNNIFLMVIVLITLILFSTSYIKYSTVINELTLLLPENLNSTFTYLVEIITGARFQVLSRFFTIFFSLYVVSFILWTLSRLDEIIFDLPTKSNYALFTQAYSLSLYVTIFDLLFQTVYMNITKQEIPITFLPYYTGFTLLLQTLVILFYIRKNKLYITSSVLLLVTSAVVFLLFYFNGV